jgi:hypothetical protein
LWVVARKSPRHREEALEIHRHLGILEVGQAVVDMEVEADHLEVGRPVVLLKWW